MCQANLQPRVGRERQKVSGQFMKSDRLAGGEVVSEGSVDQRCHERKNTLMLQVVLQSSTSQRCFDRNYNMLQMHWEKTEKQDVFGHRRGL